LLEAPVLVAFVGGLGGSPVEEMTAAGRRAATLDNLERALSTGAFAFAVVVADAADGLEALPPGVRLDVDPGPFHFGRRLASVIEQLGLRSVVYFSGGSVPLLPAQEFAGIAQELARGEGQVVANNYYSADLVAFSPAAALRRIDLPAIDNPLARLLAEQAGLTAHTLQRSIASQFDIDSPADLAVLTLVGGAGPRLQALLDDWRLDVSLYRRVLPHFLVSTAQVLVAGRSSSRVWQYLERETACRVRFFAEERGMQAEGRIERGQARSLVGFYLAAVGVQRFFATLAELADAAFLDSRVILAHLGLEPSRADRFLSDLGRYEEIEDPFLRQLTDGAARAAIPVLLGGHSLVSGGLMALIEHAWREHDRAVQQQRRVDSS
jgi:2-phospho-L-lactate guanylyltransferase (CobY/MobA/RfbA family)